MTTCRHITLRTDIDSINGVSSGLYKRHRNNVKRLKLN